MFGGERIDCCLVGPINTLRSSIDRFWRGSICAGTRNTVPIGTDAHI